MVFEGCQMQLLSFQTGTILRLSLFFPEKKKQLIAARFFSLIEVRQQLDV